MMLRPSVESAQYPSDEFRQALQQFGIEPSMSRKGNCWDNACAETLFASLKVERLHGKYLTSLRHAKDETLEWIRWYNRIRLHSTLQYVSPMQFESDWKKQCAADPNNQQHQPEGCGKAGKQNRFPTFPQPRRRRIYKLLWDTDSRGKISSKPLLACMFDQERVESMHVWSAVS